MDVWMEDENDKENTHATAVVASSKSSRPWVELYRPNRLDDVAHQPAVVQALQTAVSTGQLPHLLLYGPPGTGKTSVALALCRHLWAPTVWRRRVLELNASDERGISVVRDKIKHFASLAVGNSKATKAGGSKGMFATASKGEKDRQQDNDTSYPNPPYKIIILDEADTMTTDAQAALRRIIEAHSRITRFILIGNYVTRIIEPLASRCAKFRFQPLPPDSMKSRLRHILNDQKQQQQQRESDENDGDEKMGSSASDGDESDALLQQIVDQAQGDMRRAVTTLQSVHALQRANGESSSKPLAEDILCEITGHPPPSAAATLWKAWQTGGFDAMKTSVEDATANGWSGPLLLTALLPHVTSAGRSEATSDESSSAPYLTPLAQARVALALAEAEARMIQGADEHLQLLAVGSAAVQAWQESASETALSA